MKKTVVGVMVGLLWGSLGYADPVVRNAMGALPLDRAKVTAMGAPSDVSDAAQMSLHVKRAQFTRGLQDREPVDSLTEFEADTPRIFFFTEVAGLAGQSITHRWEHEGRVIHEQRLEIASPRFRTYSSKEMTPNSRGGWTVSVLDENGNTLETRTFTFGEGEATASAR